MTLGISTLRERIGRVPTKDGFLFAGALAALSIAMAAFALWTLCQKILPRRWREDLKR